MGHTYSSAAEDLIMVLRYNLAQGRHTPAQHRTGRNWFSCEILSVADARTEVRIANGDTFMVPTHDVRIEIAN